MPPSLFCEHKRLVSVCPICGSARAGAATPQRGPVTHDVDETIHRFRSHCHARIREYVTRVHEGESPADAYDAAYDEMTRRGKTHSEEEDTSTFRGGFYRGMIKMFDVTIDDRRIQGYNGLADWEEMRDYVFRKFDAESLDDALKEGRLRIHGGNGAWPRQQIATELIRTDAIQDAVMIVAFGDDGATPDAADDEAIVDRLARVERMAIDAGGKPGAVSLFSKVLHVFAPARWAALTPRATPEVGEVLGVPIPLVKEPRDYLAFADALREIMKTKSHDDLGWTDMAVADEWEMLQDS